MVLTSLSRYLELETVEFEMGTVMDAVVSQGMISSREKGLQLIRETPREIKNMCLFGDQVRLQQVLADFLLNAVRFTPSTEGWVGIKVVPTQKRLSGGFHVMQLEFRFVPLALDVFAMHNKGDGLIDMIDCIRHRCALCWSRDPVCFPVLCFIYLIVDIISLHICSLSNQVTRIGGSLLLAVHSQLGHPFSLIFIM